MNGYLANLNIDDYKKYFRPFLPESPAWASSAPSSSVPAPSSGNGLELTEDQVDRIARLVRDLVHVGRRHGAGRAVGARRAGGIRRAPRAGRSPPSVRAGRSLPPSLRYSDYAREVDAYVAELQEIQRTNPDSAQVDLTALREAAQQWGAASLALEAHAADLVQDDSPPSGQLRRVNRALMREERLLTQPQGLPGRPWFKHQVYAPGINTGYAAQFLPGIRDALEAGDAATVTIYRDLLLDSLRRATATASNAAGPAAVPSRSARSTAAAAATARRSARVRGWNAAPLSPNAVRVGPEPGSGRLALIGG